MDVEVGSIFIQNRRIPLQITPLYNGTIVVPDSGPFRPSGGGGQQLSSIITNLSMGDMQWRGLNLMWSVLEQRVIATNPAYRAGYAIPESIANDKAVLKGNPAAGIQGTVTVAYQRTLEPITNVIEETNLGQLAYLPGTIPATQTIQAGIANVNEEYNSAYGTISGATTSGASVTGVAAQGFEDTIDVDYHGTSQDIGTAIVHRSLGPQDWIGFLPNADTIEQWVMIANTDTYHQGDATYSSIGGTDAVAVGANGYSGSVAVQWTRQFIPLSSAITNTQLGVIVTNTAENILAAVIKVNVAYKSEWGYFVDVTPTTATLEGNNDQGFDGRVIVYFQQMTQLSTIIREMYFVLVDPVGEASIQNMLANQNPQYHTGDATATNIANYYAMMVGDHNHNVDGNVLIYYNQHHLDSVITVRRIYLHPPGTASRLNDALHDYNPNYELYEVTIKDIQFNTFIVRGKAEYGYANEELKITYSYN